ncbi:Protein C07D8.6 [Aphelenchoides avenae]|nr:Protein C07D8.6 [Aphelenchus avenae]
MSVGQRFVELSNGVRMPLIGLGTAMSNHPQVEPAIEAAVMAGYRFIDTAFIYENEEAIGNALQELFKKGTIKREDIFVSTKLPPTHMKREDVVPQLRKQLENLKLDYVDMFLVHFPAAFNKDNTEQDPYVKPEETWTGMEEAYNESLTRAIGLSNFNESQILRVLKTAEIPPHNLQVEAHINFVQNELLDLCEANNISFTAYAPLGSPGRGKSAMPKDHPYPWPPAPKPLLNPYVLQLSGKYGKPPASVLLRYLMQRGMIVVPKSVNPERIWENIQTLDFDLTDEELQKLGETKPQQRFYTQDQLVGHPEDPFADER